MGLGGQRLSLAILNHVYVGIYGRGRSPPIPVEIRGVGWVDMAGGVARRRQQGCLARWFARSRWNSVDARDVLANLLCTLVCGKACAYCVSAAQTKFEPARVSGEPFRGPTVTSAATFS